MLNRMLRYLFFGLIVRPVVMILLGLNVRHRSRLPDKGPAIIVANHNSHLDTMVLMSLFPLCMLSDIHPVAAADYFLRNRFLSWFALNIIGIIPIRRQVRMSHDDPLAQASQALEDGKLLILFPEGSRGDPEQMGKLKSGVSHLARRHPDVAVIPIYLHGLGKALPKGEALLVPFFCDVFIGNSVEWSGERHEHMSRLVHEFEKLAEECPHSDSWE